MSRRLELNQLRDARLVGAACAGRWPMFDESLPGETTTNRYARLQAAGQICAICPVIAACDAAACELGTQATGFWSSALRSVEHR